MTVYRTRAAARLAAARANPDGAYSDIATRALIVRCSFTRALGKVYTTPRRLRDPKTGTVSEWYGWQIGA
jgi:hypothetical protein